MGDRKRVVAGSSFGLFLEYSSRTVVPLLWQLQIKCNETGIMTGELPIITTTNAVMDNCITYWDHFGIYR